MKSRILFYISCILCAFSLGSFFTVLFFNAKLASASKHAADADAHSYNVVTENKQVPNSTTQDTSQFVPSARSSLSFTPDEQINIKIYGMRNKSVVNITTEVLAYNWFFEPQLQEGGVGSGSIIDEKGHILTNYHVIEDANKVRVTLWNDEQREGVVVGYDVESDLAIIKINPQGLLLEPIPFGDSSHLQIGQKVLAIGNPFAFDRTLTSGIISGLGRPIRTRKNIIIQNMIQTDASINPGNSGGPLLNDAGELIGVNTIIYTPSRGSVGVGFAVSSQTVVRVVNDILKYGTVQRGWIWWNVQPLLPELVRYARLPVEKGLLVTTVQSGKNADKAGIRGGRSDKAVRYGRTIIYLGGDIITAIDGKPVHSIASLLEALERTKPGKSITVEYYRDKKKHTARITLEDRPENLNL